MRPDDNKTQIQRNDDGGDSGKKKVEMKGLDHEVPMVEDTIDKIDAILNGRKPKGNKNQGISCCI